MKRSKEEIAQSLQDSWRQEYLFELKATLGFYRPYQQALFDCDQVIEQALRRSVPPQPDPKTPSTAKKKSSKDAPAPAARFFC